MKKHKIYINHKKMMFLQSFFLVRLVTKYYLPTVYTYVYKKSQNPYGLLITCSWNIKVQICSFK